MDTPADALASNEPEPTAAAAAAVQPETAIVPVPAVTAFHGASTSVPEPTAATVQPGTVVLSMRDVHELFRASAPVTNNFHSGAVYNATTVEAGATFNNAERQTMYTGGGAPNGTGGSSNEDSATIARIASLVEHVKERTDHIGERTDRIDERTAHIGEQNDRIEEKIDRILTATVRKAPQTDYGSPPPMQSPDDTYQTAPDGTMYEALVNALLQKEQGVTFVAPGATYVAPGGVYKETARGGVCNETNVAANSGATFNNAERQTMYTGGGAPNGTSGSPNVSAPAMEVFASRLEKKMDDLHDTVIGQTDRCRY
jgi:hypothetical protein